MAALLLAPVGAQARVACPAEQTALTAANGAQVSDAIFCLTNQIRANYGLPAFRRDSRLDTAALLHSRDMATRNFFAHVTPDGVTPSDRAAAQGYPTGAGENIANGYPTATAVVLAWMASAGHCRNILGSARDIGIGTFGAGSSYFTQSFGSYGSGASGTPSAACPYTLDLETLVVADTPSGATAPAATVSGRAADATLASASRAARPAIRKLAISHRRLRARRRGHRLPRVRLAYKLSAPATVRLRVERVRGGRRAGPRCVAATASNRSAALCRRYVKLAGHLTDAGKRGANRFSFSARLRGRPLAPGRYRLRAVATDNACRASRTRFAGFRIVRR